MKRDEPRARYRVASAELPRIAAEMIASGARTGVLLPDQQVHEEHPIWIAMAGDAPVWKAMHDAQQLQDAPPHLAEVMAQLEEYVRANDGYTLEARAGAMLELLGVPASSHRTPLRDLSAVLARRVLLARALIGGRDVLVLDDPTHLLDAAAIRGFEAHLESYAGAAIVASSDLGAGWASDFPLLGK